MKITNRYNLINCNIYLKLKNMSIFFIHEYRQCNLQRCLIKMCIQLCILHLKHNNQLDNYLSFIRLYRLIKYNQLRYHFITIHLSILYRIPREYVGFFGPNLRFLISIEYTTIEFYYYFN